MGRVQAASSYRDTVCVGTESRRLGGDVIKKIDALIERAVSHPSGVAGTFVTVFVESESVMDLRRGITAASALNAQLEGTAKVRTWPIDLKFLAHQEQPCTSGSVLVEVSILLNETPVIDPKQ